MNRSPASASVNIGFGVAATAAAASPFWAVYRSVDFLIMVAATIVIGGLLAGLSARFRWPSAVVVPAVIVVYFAFGVPLAIPDQALSRVLPTLGSESALATATVTSWKQLVTISVPVGSYQALLVPAFILVLLTIVITLVTALRSRRPELAVLPPVGLFVSAILLGATDALWPLIDALALLGLLIFWLLWFRWRRRTMSIHSLAEQSGVAVETPGERRLAGLGTVLSALLILVIAGAVGTAATILVPTTVPRNVVRTHVVQPFNPRDYPSPLVGFRRYLEPANAKTPLFTVRGLGDVRHVRIATLDTYDGVVYSVGSGNAASGSFTRVPYRLDQAGVNGERVSLNVTISGYRGVWVPSDGQLQQVRFTGDDAAALSNAFFYNDTTGTSAVTRPLGSGDAYTLDAVVKPERTAAQLGTAMPGDAALPRVSVVPDELVSTLQDYAGSATTPGAKLAAALKALAKNGYISHGIGDEPVSRSGHSADRITQLLTDVPMIGDQEQYAVTAALMARQLGFPARVVFGFALPKGQETSSSVTFTGADVSAWIEVQTRADGWVSVDPNPPVRPIPKKQPDTPRQISRPQTMVQPPKDETVKPPEEAPPSHVDDNPDTMSGLVAILLAVLAIAGWSLLGLAILAAPFLAVIAAKLRRRVLRRRAATSIDRITGGWREFADTAVDYGYEAAPTATRLELAEVVGGMPPLVLASAADRAVFSPTAPKPEEADAVWQAVRDLRTELGSRRTRWQRLRAAVSLRSFAGYRGSQARKKGER
ncbi:transglutaminaseTgpA domain-containing protein [Microbacterium sp. STN6]|uniref:DUF3488 and transglutaminase-like domain-containing protein n=1 Tax=Microbacterium sp. STN6 TaxID=2995588 RepID=UPI002260D2DA|nr:transglutaminase domain-containing protein [Microbacterium sp. STN6]MCX7521193.1 transglutaminaseTgpA domain-containing protein [Microbacterium sp. STN6]